MKESFITPLHSKIHSCTNIRLNGPLDRKEAIIFNSTQFYVIESDSEWCGENGTPEMCLSSIVRFLYGVDGMM